MTTTTEETTPMTKITVPGRLIDFYRGGGAYQAWDGGQGNTSHRDWPAADELELFQACAAAKAIRPSKGGYYVRVELSEAGLGALRYWAETLESASADNARDGDQDARNDLRAAQRALKAVHGW
jgi:hypothetical protein